MKKDNNWEIFWLGFIVGMFFAGVLFNMLTIITRLMLV